MKKHLIVAAGVAILSTSAFATKARMQALGQSTETGSFYLSDTRNVWSNPAEINNTKDYVVLEVGSANIDATQDVGAEGGFFKEIGNFTAGIYYGNRNKANNVLRAGEAFETVNPYRALAELYDNDGVNTGQANFLTEGNGVDLFIGGDAGIQWGAHLNYMTNTLEKNALASASSTQAGINNFEKETESLGLDFGVIAGDINAWLNMNLKDESKGGSVVKDSWEADKGLDLGAGYALGNGMSVTVNYVKSGFSYKPAGVETTTGETSSFAVNFAKVWEMSSNGRVFGAFDYTRSTAEITDKTSGGKKYKLEVVSPIATFGFEADANSWLTLRGSFEGGIGLPGLAIRSLEVTHDTVKGDTSFARTAVSVNTGATLNFGKLKIDGTIGTTGGTLKLDTLLSNVSMHYWF